MNLIRQAEVYQPGFIGKKDILTAGEKIIKVENEIDIRSPKYIGKLFTNRYLKHPVQYQPNKDEPEHK